jgi:hypothetical protein
MDILVQQRETDETNQEEDPRPREDERRKKGRYTNTTTVDLFKATANYWYRIRLDFVFCRAMGDDNDDQWSSVRLFVHEQVFCIVRCLGFVGWLITYTVLPFPELKAKVKDRREERGHESTAPKDQVKAGAVMSWVMKKKATGDILYCC